MRIGTRWSAGAQPHSSVPIELHDTILQIDSDGSQLSWMLTWLEGRPVCRRGDDIVVTLSPAGEIHTTYPESDTAQATGMNEFDSTDDDWLLE